ncbi:MAG: hypothetical protein JO169_06155 [Solirubrobacterales bacterium]|nr:hypothetical protein [Solirubrobacterales bacterium]
MSARVDPRRVAPTLLAGALAALYVIVSPPSLDLAAHVFRAQLFRSEGFALWNNWWYAGHHIVGYSVLFPAVSAALSPQLAAAIAATATAAVFEPLAHRRYGADAWLGALVFGAATATSLFTGRLAFAFGALPAVAAILALDRGRTWLAASLAALAALCSPVAALFAALGAAAHALGSYLAERELRVAWPGIAVAIAAIAPVAAFAVAFPEGGSEPFAFAALWPIPLLALGTLLALPAGEPKLRAGVALYTLATIACYLVPSPVGSNAARLGTFLAAPLAALLWWPRKALLLALAAAPLLYLEWQAPIRDLVTAVDDPSYSADYYEPLLRFLSQQTGPRFRVEVPFTRFHWEAYAVASRYPIARGWERQLDIEDNALFYRGRLTAAAYEAWLHREAVRFVAAADAPLDYSAEQEMALIDRGLPYLRLAMRTAHWRVYEVSEPTPIVQGAATLRSIGGDWLSLYAGHTGSALVRVRFTPYWKLAQGAGCVSRAGQFTRVTIRRPGSLRLVASFSLGRIGASSPRCS